MKKALSVASLLLAMLPASQVLADQDIGCGLGTVLFEGKSGVAPKVLGATTNATFGNQTFGITFGTLGCQSEGTITSRAKLTMFIDGNMDNLARDIARGNGETLSTLTEVWGISDADKASFNLVVKQNFAVIFSGDEVNSQAVMANLNQVVANSELSAYTLS
ncbi:DUF3015 family protein [Shewanella sp. NIFS-20-20]|uniref:DUF3015 family protein n=1 Tax=Shewanella sp. NIFS-20-20 TaxID=2853806 RepID=UPI001C439CB4|nr:DUF3015 family protein [Shewanella sp. NIFS-20-20]MBV7315393.1 DUF3015 domain-containing protein [Shewanella sp. NIFS-20-20]